MPHPRRWSRLYENQVVCVRKIEWLQAIDLARPRSCKREWVFCTPCISPEQPGCDWAESQAHIPVAPALGILRERQAKIPMRPRFISVSRDGLALRPPGDVVRARLEQLRVVSGLQSCMLRKSED